MYLGISIPPISLSLRYTLDCLVVGEGAPYSARRHYLETVVPIFASLGIALTCPQVAAPLTRHALLEWRAHDPAASKCGAALFGSRGRLLVFATSLTSPSELTERRCLKEMISF